MSKLNITVANLSLREVYARRSELPVAIAHHVIRIWPTNRRRDGIFAVRWHVELEVF